MFISFVIAFVLAVSGFYQGVQTPGLWPAVVALVVLIANEMVRRGWKRNREDTLRKHPVWVKGQYLTWLSNVLLGFIIGWSWVFWQTFFSVSVDENWVNRPVQIQGTVIGLPEVEHGSHSTRMRFMFELQKIGNPGSGFSAVQSDLQIKTEQAWSILKPKVQLNWYIKTAEETAPQVIPKPGEQWQFTVKLRANHASMNLGALDYETWLYQNRIAAKGYIIQKSSTKEANRKLEDSSVYGLRYHLAQRLSSAFERSELGGIYQALSYGDKHNISDAQWQVLQNTGTVHLMAISGLHMGIVAALGYWIFKGLWWLGLYRVKRFNLPVVAATGGLLFASFYLILSGFAIPTQRAYLMVLAVLLFLFLKRPFQPWQALFLAAFSVVLWDPRSVLSVGFWLSFMAVALIFAVLQIPMVKRSSRWLQLLWIQLALTAGLAPYLLWMFHFLPSYSLIANLVAVPFVSFIGLPLVFVVSVISLFSVDFAVHTVAWLDWIWKPIWNLLVSMNDRSVFSSIGGSLEFWQVVTTYVLLFATLLKKPIWIRFSAGVFLLIFSVWSLGNPLWSRPENRQAWLHVLDVGQGQALVIETRNHVMIYDTGAKWGDKMDGAKLAILPFLRAQNRSEVDLVMVSHSDIDHAGGLERLLRQFRVKHVVSGQPKKVQEGLSGSYPVENCSAGQKWNWDGVVFEVLSPGVSEGDVGLRSDNDRSCVLKVTAGGRSGSSSVLISGDLSAKGEKRLIELYGDKLKADILVAGHHGSRYSTSSIWLRQVQPEVVVFSAGYHNRYHFPTEETLQRLAPEIFWFNTACSGGIGYEIGNESGKFNPLPAYQVRKTLSKWYHHSCLTNEKGILFQ